LALAAALAPFAANARSDRGPVQDPAHQQYLVGNQQATVSHGRSSEFTPATGQAISTAPQYASVNDAGELN
jgi:hypothetical protein